MDNVQKKNGGKREGAGRKTKADEDRIRSLSFGALTKVFGGESEAFEYLAERAQEKNKEAFPYFKLSTPLNHRAGKSDL